MSKELTIVIPVFQNWILTAKCIASIFKSTYSKENYEIIIVDNASTDKTESLINYLIKKGEPIKYLKMKENLDYCKGANVGWREAKTPFIMLLNNDVILEETCIEKMMEAIKTDKKIGIVTVMEYLPNGQTRETPFTYLNIKDLRSEKYNPILKCLKDVKQDFFGLVDVDIAGGAACIMRKEVSDKIGYYDEIFSPCMHEHEDYCLRIKLAGYRVVMIPYAKMVHFVGATTAFNNAYYNNVCKENTQKFIKKWKNLKWDVNEKI